MQKTLIDAETGLPQFTEEQKEQAAAGAQKTIPLMLIVSRVIGVGIALAIYWPWKDIFDARMAKLDKSIENIGFLYLAIGVFSILVNFMNLFPTIAKTQIMLGTSGHLRSNMSIYKILYQNGQRAPYVVMEDEHEVGKYNRANRALHHLVENAMPLMMIIPAAGLIMPIAVFVLVALYAIARIWYQIAYTTGGYGLGCCQHGPPFGFQFAQTLALEGLVWVIGVRLLMGVA